MEGDLPPGSKCEVICDVGYIAAVGHHRTTCQEGGTWSQELVCEVPLVILSGGTEVGKGPSVEVVNLGVKQGCPNNFNIPELPQEVIEERKFHNLVYLSPVKTTKPTLLVCNGLSTFP